MENNRIRISSLVLLTLICGCTSITSTLEKQQGKKVGIRQPKKEIAKSSDTLNTPNFITYVDDQGVEQKIMKSTTDSVTGESLATIDLKEVTVVAKSKTASERNGKVNIDFIVSVPSTLINNKWQVQLTPVLYKNTRQQELEKIFLSGADFLKMQKKGYDMYKNFIASIIPDSAYMQKLFDENGYSKSIQSLEEQFYQAWKNDLLSEREFIDWRDRMNRRFLYFNAIMENNKLTVEGRRTWKKKLPAYWMRREVDKSIVKSSWVNFLDPEYNISRKTISKTDSMEIYNKFFDFNKMRENERKKEQIEEKYREYVRFPIQPARLDSVIQNGSSFDYYYQQEIPVEENLKKMLLTLNGNILAIDKSTYSLPASDTLTFYISSIAQFIDKTTHYKTQIVNRQAQANMTAYINFEKGKSTFDEKYMNNESEITSVVDALHKLTFTGELEMDSINMTATSSPEGNKSINLQLSQQRSKSIKKYLDEVIDDNEQSSKFNPMAIGEDWVKLTGLISSSKELFHQNEILEIIRTTGDLDERENKIKQYKADYNYILENLYPDCRAVNFSFYLHRKDMIQDTIHTTIIDTEYMRALDDVENRQYTKALTVLEEYQDYNTAICLMSLGYDERALTILKKQPSTSDKKYLMAILSMRLKNEGDAVRFFKESVKMDYNKLYRGELDPEINKLITTYKLNIDEEANF